MEINTKIKTKVMVIAKEPEQCSLQRQGARIEKTDAFTYLGIFITEDGRCIGEIRYRITESTAASNKLEKNLEKKVPIQHKILGYRVMCRRFSYMHGKRGRSMQK